jgi:hypothetical protein
MKKLVLVGISSSLVTAVIAAIIVSPVTRVTVSHTPGAWAVRVGPVLTPAVYHTTQTPKFKRGAVLVEDIGR